MTSVSLQSEQERFEIQDLRPAWNPIAVFFALMALAAPAIGVAFVTDQRSAMITWLAIAGAVFIGLIFLAIACSLRGLQLIEWRLDPRVYSAMLPRSS